MEFKLKISKDVQKSYVVCIFHEEIQQMKEKILKNKQKEIQLPGFRKGFAPIGIIEKKVNLDQELKKNIFNKVYSEILNKFQLKNFFDVEIGVFQYDSHRRLFFSITFYFYPCIPDIDFSKFSISIPKIAVTEEMVEKEMVRLGKTNPDYEKKNVQFIKKDDLVVINFSVKNGKEEIFRKENFIINLERNGEFLRLLEGKKLNKPIKLRKLVEMENAFGIEFQGKILDWNIVPVSVVKLLNNTKLDDKFAQKLGYSSLSSLRIHVKKRLTDNFKRNIRFTIKKQIFDIFVRKLFFNLPANLVRLEEKNITLEDKKRNIKKTHKEIVERAEKKVKVGLVLREIIRKYSITVSSSDIERQISNLVKSVRKKTVFFDSKKKIDRVTYSLILEEKAVNFVLSRIKKIEKQVDEHYIKSTLGEI